jgi:hypothetical protein
VRCAIPDAAWIRGPDDGRWCLISWCRIPAVSLHQTASSLYADKRRIDDTGCGGGCTGDHQTFKIDITTQTINSRTGPRAPGRTSWWPVDLGPVIDEALGIERTPS